MDRAEIEECLREAFTSDPPPTVDQLGGGASRVFMRYRVIDAPGQSLEKNLTYTYTVPAHRHYGISRPTGGIYVKCLTES